MTIFYNVLPDNEKALTDVQQIIANTFDWATSIEGYAYWNEVYVKILRIRMELINSNLATAQKVTISPSSSPSYTPKPLPTKPTPSSKQSLTTHVLEMGRSLCGTVKGKPVDWPKEHNWTYRSEVQAITCIHCIQEIGNQENKVKAI